MEMDEQSSDSQQPGFWESWTAASANPSGVPQASEAGQAGTSGQAPDSGQAGQFSAPDPVGQLPAFTTQPIGYPQAGYPAPGYGQPGYGQASYPQAGYPQQGQPGYTAPGQPGYAGYSYPPGGGFGQPPGGYGGPGGFGLPPRPPRRRGLTAAITYLAVAAIAATAGGLVVAFADGSQPPAASSGSTGSGNLGLPGGGLFPGGGGGNSNSGNNGSSGNSGGAGAVSGSTIQRLKASVTPGLVVITSNLKYDGNGVAAAATGMIISHDGLVLTNNHVINGTTGLTARVVQTGRQYTATWLGYDKGSDVAVIKLDGASNLPTVPIGDSSTVKVGEDVVGMGNANGTGSISYVGGSITNLNQTITASDDGSGQAAEKLTGMLQTNAQIIPGDSGGPLVSTDGKVIGMDTAASTNSSTANSGQNVGFAIPINRAISLARQIIAGQPGRGIKIGSSGFVGVLVPSNKGSQSTKTSPAAQLRQEEAQDQAFGQTNPAPSGCVQSNQNAGVPSRIAPVSSGTLVLGSLCHTPAAMAGIGAGDVITRVNNKAVSSPASLMNILQGMHGGASVKITWVTPGNQTVTRTLTLSVAPPQ
jgi:S1-C subfamily serine protease